MEKRKVGRTSLEVTEISFGCAAIGGLYRAVDYESAMKTLATAWNAGLRYFDVAPFYGFGLAERRLGDFLRDKPRDELVISTKVGRLLRPVPRDQVPDHSYVEPLDFAVDYDYSYDGIMRSVEFSYARMGLNKIDILFVHDIGAYTHGAEVNDRHFRTLMDSGMKALEELKSSGTISAYGLGVNETAVCVDVLSRIPLDIILLAGRYSLLDRSAEAGMLEWCEKRGTTLAVGGVFNSGILATGPVPGANFDYGPASEEVLAKVRALDEVSARHGLTTAAAALRFPLMSKLVSSVLIGTARPSSLTRNLELLGVDIPAAVWAEYQPHTIR